MSRKLDDLAPEFQPLAKEFLARLTEARIPVVIVDTRRTPEEQAKHVANGVSWTLNSRHLTGHAMDIAPWNVYQLHGPSKLNWDSRDPVWNKIATIAESCGLVSGHRWTKRDSGHVEMPKE